VSGETDDRICPLCEAGHAALFYRDGRDYFRCHACELVFVLPHAFLSRDQEKATYDHHQNSPDDPQYRRFLDRLFSPLSRRLAPGSRGLDFGSGPGPTLSIMFEEAGHSMAIYDPFYAPGTAPLQQEYHFVAASEVVEHLHHPRRDLERIWACLKSGGVLGIMTKRRIDDRDFSTWHYKNDPTHVCFFSMDTFRWLADHWNATLVAPDQDVVLLIRTAER